MSVNWLWIHGARQRKRIALLASGLLPDQERAELERHLAQCPACRRYHAELEPIGRALARAGGALPNVEPSAALTARWIRAVRLGQSPKPQTASAGKPFRHGGILRARNIPGQRVAWAGLAVAWGLILFFNLTAPPLDPPSPRRVAVAPQAVLRLLRFQDEGWVRWRAELQRNEHRRGLPLDQPSPRTRRERDLYVA